MSTAPARPGWPFLIGRGRDAGYRMLLTPRPVADGDDSDALLAVVTGEVPADAPPVVTVAGPRPTGELCVVYRTLRASTADTGRTGATGYGRDVPLLDRAGRPLVLAYGFVCPGGRVTRVDEADLRHAREVALAAFRTFHADEAAYRPEVSEAYPLRSEIAARPAYAGPDARQLRSEPSRPEASWRAEALPSAGRVGKQHRWRPPALLLGLFAALAVLAGAGIWLAAPPAEVRVPEIVELPEADAVRELRGAGLHAVPGPERWGEADCRPGRVVGQSPAAGTRVREQTRVVYVLCPERRPPVPPAPTRSAPAPERPPSGSALPPAPPQRRAE